MSLAILESFPKSHLKALLDHFAVIEDAAGALAGGLSAGGGAAAGGVRHDLRLHWVLDVVFGDDQSRLRKGHGAHTMAVVRHFALNLVRAAPAIPSPPPSPLFRRPNNAASPSRPASSSAAKWPDDKAYLHDVLGAQGH